MTTKEYLRQIRNADREITRLLVEMDDIKAQLFRIGAVKPKSVQVQTSADPDRISRMVEKLISQEERVTEKIDALIDLKEKITYQIDQLGNQDYRDVLYYRYVTCMPWHKIVGAMNYSEPGIYKLHGKALIAFRYQHRHIFESV